MAKKVSIFGVRGAGKTCYIYAMAQVMQMGAKCDGTRISMIANNLKQQNRLNRGYAELADQKWPVGSMTTTLYDFKVRLQHDDEYHDILPSLLIRDYRGGLLQSEEDDDDNEYNELLESFSDSCAIVFLVDGETLLRALDPEDVDVEHRNPMSTNKILEARNQISFVENLFMEYKKRNSTIPPVMVAITKADVFLSKEEIENGKRLIKAYIPSAFSKGCGIDAAITSLSLGDNLSKDYDNRLCGKLILDTSRNIHLPIIYALYAYLDSVYDGSTQQEQYFIDDVMKILRKMFKNHVDLYFNGKLLFKTE